MRTITLPKELPIDETLPLNLFDYSSSQEVSKQQIHLSQNTFSFLLEGHKEVISSTTSFAIQNASFLLMQAGPCLMTEKLPSSRHNYRSLLLFFSDEVLARFAQKHQIQAASSVKAQSVQAFHYDDFIKNFLNSLLEVQKLPLVSRKRLLTIKFEEIMLYLLEMHGSDFIQALLTYTDNHTQNFINVVENNKLKKLTLKELSFLSHMSVSSFKRTFEKHYQASPIKWFNDQRLAHASFLLKQEQKRPSDIYLEVGYENLSSFIQAFKSKYGVTPKQF